MKLKTKLSKLRHDGHITDAEYAVIINVLNKFSTQPPKTKPYEDCISRQAAIDVVRKWFDKIQLNGDICLDGIISLPSVTPKTEPCEDYIKRADVLALAEKGVLVSNDNYQAVCKAINELPSVMPKRETITDFVTIAVRKWLSHKKASVMTKC